MHPFQPNPRRKTITRLQPEQLESRELLTGGGGDTFAIVPGTITKANQPAVVKFTIDPTHFTVPKGKFTVGIDIVSDSTSTLKGSIVGVQNSNGLPVGGVTHGIYSSKLPAGTVTRGGTTSAVLAPISMHTTNPNGTVTYSVRVKGLQGTTGKFLLGFYLPGDANGDGTVTAADITTIKSEMGAIGGSTKYTFDADSNRDGHISQNDLKIAQKNLGVSTTISPSITANLDPASVNTATARTTTNPVVHFTGTTTPGAAVKYTEVAGLSQPIATTSNASGNYSLYVTLGAGSNTFQVTSLDAFGQSITGTISPVTLQTNHAVTPASLNQTATATMTSSTTKTP